MKYLKKFNESEDISLRVLEDICFELEDADMTVKVTNKYIRAVSNDISSLDNDKKWEDIKDTVLRIKDYLGDNFIEFSYLDSIVNPHVVKLDENTEIKGLIFQFIISYKPI